MDSHRLLPNIPPFLTVPEMISWDHMDPYGTIRFSWRKPLDRACFRLELVKRARPPGFGTPKTMCFISMFAMNMAICEAKCSSFRHI